MDDDEPCNLDGYLTVQDLDTLDQWVAEPVIRASSRSIPRPARPTRPRPNWSGSACASRPTRCYIPFGHGGTDLLAEVPVQIPVAAALERIKALCEDPSVLKIGQNLKFDMIVLGERGIAIAPHDDTIVLSFDLDAGLHGHGMDELAATHLSHTCLAFKEVVGTGKKQLGFHEST